MFGTFKNLKRALLSRAKNAKKVEPPKTLQGLGQNSNDDVIVSEFRRQFLTEMSRSEGEIVALESPFFSLAKMA